jgi:hypothetical protein
MELAMVSRVIVETTPTFHQKVTQTLIQRGALMRRVLPLVYEGGASTTHRDGASNRVILEAVVDRAETNALVQALSEVCSDSCSVAISVSEVPLAEADLHHVAVKKSETSWQEKWISHLITI